MTQDGVAATEAELRHATLASDLADLERLLADRPAAAWARPTT